MVGEGRHRWLRLHQQQHQCARTTVAKASLLRTRAAFCMQRRPRRRCMPSTWLQRARRLPCLALTLALCVALLSACLPASRTPSLPLCVPGRLRFALSCSLAAHARTALRLAVVLVHRSWRLKLTHPPPPPTSPPRLRTPRRLCALVRSQVGTREQPTWLARVRRRGRQASLSPSQRFTGGVTKRPNDIPRLCCRRNLPSGDLYTFRVVERGIVVSYWFAPSPYFKPGVLARFGAQVPVELSVSYCACIVAHACIVFSCWTDGP